MGVSESGIITQVRKDVRGGRRHDLGERVLLPSALDLHVHFRDPGPPGEVESIATGSAQAALAGVAAVVDMPNTMPPTTTVERIEDKERRIRATSYIDVLPYAALGPDSHVETLATRAAGFKLYLAPTTGDLGVDPNLDLAPLLQRVAATGLPLHVHAEDPKVFGPLTIPQDPVGWDAARPPRSEMRALNRLLPGPAPLRLHVCHLTSAAAVGRVREAHVSGEATVHHLLLSAKKSLGTFGKVNPPLRTEAERAALWEAFKAGSIPMMGSDHAPHSREAKERPFPEAPSGVPGVETSLPLLLARTRAGDLELNTLLSAVCRRPSLFLGLPQGRLEPGLEASFMVVDFRQRRTLRARDLHAPCGWTPFEGWEGVFPTDHYLRGERLVEDGELVGRPRGRARRALPSLR